MIIQLIINKKININVLSRGETRFVFQEDSGEISHAVYDVERRLV